MRSQEEIKKILAGMHWQEIDDLLNYKNVWRWSKWAILIGILMWVALAAGCPQYNVYKRQLDGEAQLREAEWNRQIAIQEAEAARQSASLLAEAEVERAKGVAEANKIIADGLGGPEGYLRYIWIQSLKDDSTDVIYVPTEANIPILEAGKR